ncbi:MAG: DUF3750 domain-containing protein [Planctomycetota bacterium]
MIVPTVELWAAPIPILGRFADHHWLVVREQTGSHRWEVWQRKDVGGVAWGYLHRDLMPPKANVGFGPSRHVRSWVGDDAVAIGQRLEKAPATYPWTEKYRYYPGPNSNTFAQWVLAGVFRLRSRAPGAWYARFAVPSR